MSILIGAPVDFGRNPARDHWSGGEPAEQGDRRSATAGAAEEQRSRTAWLRECICVGAKVKKEGKDCCTGAPDAEILQIFFA